eukprot:scaffold431_cov334-Pavlova_lutheri.AAC.54
MAQDTAGMEVGNASWLGKRESFKAKRRNGRGCIIKHERGTIVVAKFCIMGWTNGQERSVFAPWLPIFCVGTSPVRSRV